MAKTIVVFAAGVALGAVSWEFCRGAVDLTDDEYGYVPDGIYEDIEPGPVLEPMDMDLR
jgi:hypothetical protein